MNANVKTCMYPGMSEVKDLIEGIKSTVSMFQIVDKDLRRKASVSRMWIWGNKESSSCNPSEVCAHGTEVSMSRVLPWIYTEK